ncbi:hypothetical protein LB504_011068 [Fusarium proliferatum]|nr:hypothetical protein LB504_011068 [Fusarium proliferatum]
MFGSYFRQIEFLQAITVYTSKDPARRYSIDTLQKPENKVISNKLKSIVTITFDGLYCYGSFITLSIEIDYKFRYQRRNPAS